MKNRSNDALLHDVVSSVVQSWDPYGLLAGGAPLSEFESEITRIAARAPRIQSEADAVRALAEVFSESFEPGGDFAERFYTPGRKLYERLHSAGLVSVA